MHKEELIFKVIEPSGKVYKIYTNGKTEGFAKGSCIFKYHIGLLNRQLATQYLVKGSIASSCPATKAISSELGGLQG